MTRKTEDTEIYISSYDLLQVLSHTVKYMRRDFKGILGMPSMNLCTDIILSIIKTNSLKDADRRVEELERMSDLINRLIINIRLLKDLKLIDPSRFARCIELSTSMSCQCERWLSYCKRSRNRMEQAPT